MKYRHLFLLVLWVASRGSAQTSGILPKPEIAPLPPLTMVELEYQNPFQKPDAPAPKQSSFVFKGQNCRIATRQWSDSRTTYDIRIQKTQFYTDPTASEKYKDYVQAVDLPPDGYAVADFPELGCFAGEKTSAVESKLAGRAAYLLTAPPSEVRYTDEKIRAILNQVGNSPEREEIQKNLKEAQKLEAKRLALPPNRVWLDAQTRLPLRAELDGTTIVYAYQPSIKLPQLPAFIVEAIIKRFGQMPPM
jgi:hypothetical protein